LHAAPGAAARGGDSAGRRELKECEALGHLCREHQAARARASVERSPAPFAGIYGTDETAL
jgi:hypothetical protein